jgi:hypothetical protein
LPDPSPVSTTSRDEVDHLHTEALKNVIVELEQILSEDVLASVSSP